MPRHRTVSYTHLDVYKRQDLSTTQAANVTFSPWLTQLAELFHPRVLRHVIPVIVGWQLAVQAGVSLMQVLYDCPDRKTAADFLRRQRRDRVGRLELPYTVLPHNLDQAREESILLRVGGPVPVVIPNGYAAVTERNARFMRVLPPGYHILGRFEYLLGVVDLQPQTRTANDVTMLTREGIPVKTDIGLTFAIDPGDEPDVYKRQRMARSRRSAGGKRWLMSIGSITFSTSVSVGSSWKN